MSSTYIPEPPTTGKVILVTSHGELDIELWSRETPLACKNFIQLCLEGYYDKNIFHRLIPGFMIQGGDPTGTGTGGESIYGDAFKDEFHQRLKFTHRGLIAMANTGRNTNKSQFFITFGEALHLNKKHTIFGKVIGNTMFNLMSMQAEETDSNDRPTIPPKILKTRVIVNPFDDIKPRTANKEQEDAKVKEEKEKREKQVKEESKIQTKQLKKKNLLSFEEEQVTTQDKIQSSHDVLDDKKLLKKAVITQEELEWKRKTRELQEQRKQELKKAAITEEAPESSITNLAFELKQQMKRKLPQTDSLIKVQDDITKFEVRINPQSGKREIFWKQDLPQPLNNSESSSQEIDDDQLKEVRELQKKQFDAIKLNELKFKEVQEGSLNPVEKVMRMQEKSLLSNVEKRRMQFLQKRDMDKHQGSMLDRLEEFRKRIKSKNKEEMPEWASHRLKFHIDSENAFKHSGREGNNGVGIEDDGGLMVVDSTPQEYKLKRKGMDLDELYALSKQE